MGGFGDLLGGLFGMFGEGAVEGAAETAAVFGEGDGDEPGADAVDTTRYLVGGPRVLNINDI
jgi:hypothetical protein